jgi:two-component system chemotaxis response regulator CheV
MENTPMSAAAIAEGMELLLFYIDDECYGIDILKVKEVIPRPPLTAVPHSHAAVSGVLQLRGAPLTVVDLMRAIDKGEGMPDDGSGSVIVSEYLGGRQGFLVSSVDRIIYCGAEDFHASPPGAGDGHYIERVARVEETLIQVLDMERILARVLPASGAASRVA